MTASEIEQMATAITTAMRKAGVFGAQATKTDRASDKIDKRNDKIMLATATSVRGLGDEADDAAKSLRSLSKSSSLAVMGLARFSTALSSSTKGLTGTVKTSTRTADRRAETNYRKELSETVGKAVANINKTNEREVKALNSTLDKLNGRIKQLDAATSKKTKLNIVKGGGVDPKTRDLSIIKGGGPNVKALPSHEAKERPEPSKKLQSKVIVDESKYDQKSMSRSDIFMDRYNAFRKPPPKKPDEKLSKKEKAFQAAEEGRKADNSKLLKATGLKILGLAYSKSIEALNIAFDTLAARGYGLFDSFGAVASGAAHAGMSMQEYAKLMDENMGVVARSSSLADFNTKLQYGVKGLNKLGTFGEDAARASGAMLTSATELGIPQEKLRDSTDAQTSIFQKLQRTVGLTAGAFADLTLELSRSTIVQAEVAALEPQERIARQAQLVDQMSYAKGLGLSTQAQQTYTAAIIAQRKTTVKERFNTAGRLMQTAGMLGMGADKTEELRGLSMNRYKDPEQQKRYMDLLGEVNSGMEKMQQQGGPGSQYQSDVMRENLGGISQDLEAATQIKLGKDSGKTANADMGKTLGLADQKIGEILTLMKGWGANPFVQLGIGAAAAITSAFVGWKLMAVPMGTIMGKEAGTIIAAMMKASGFASAAGADGSGQKYDMDGNPIDKNGKKGTRAERKAARAAAKAGKAGTAAKVATAVGGATSLTGVAAAGAGSGGGIAGAAGKGLGFLGSAVSRLAIPLAIIGGLFEGVTGWMSAEEDAKKENGGDGDVGKKKGEAVGGAATGTAAAIGASLAIAPLAATLAPLTGGLSLLLVPLAGLAGAFGGGAVGKLIGGMIGSENASEKAARETKELANTMNQDRRAKMGSTVIDASTLAGLPSNVLNTAIASTTVSKEEAKAAYDKKKKDEADEADKKKKAETARLEATPSSGYAYNPDLTADENYRAAADQSEAEEKARKKAATAKPTPDTSTPISALPGSASTLASVNAATIALPTSMAPNRVNPTTVNTPDKAVEAQQKIAAQVAPVNATTEQTAAIERQNTLVEKQNALLQQQVDATADLARSLALRSGRASAEELYRRAGA